MLSRDVQITCGPPTILPAVMAMAMTTTRPYIEIWPASQKTYCCYCADIFPSKRLYILWISSRLTIYKPNYFWSKMVPSSSDYIGLVQLYAHPLGLSIAFPNAQSPLEASVNHSEPTGKCRTAPSDQTHPKSTRHTKGSRVLITIPFVDAPCYPTSHRANPRLPLPRRVGTQTSWHGAPNTNQF